MKIQIIFASLDEHTIINEKNNDESSQELNKKKQLNNINFEINNEEILKSSL